MLALEVDRLKAEGLSDGRKELDFFRAAELDGGLGEPHSRIGRAVFGNALKLFVGVDSGGLQYHVCKRVLAHVLYFTKKHRGLCCVLTV